MVEDEDHQTKEGEVQNMTYDIMDPITNIFNEIEDLAELAEATDNEYSDMQSVKFGLEIIKNTGNFEHDLRLWVGKAQADKTWVNFKAYFEEAHHTLKATRGKTMKSSSFHTINMLATQALAEVQAVQASVLQALEKIPDKENVPPEPVSNSATTYSTQPATLKLLKSMQVEIKELKENKPSPENNTSNTSFNKITEELYCWLHGLGHHKGCDFIRKYQVHQDDATVKKKEWIGQRLQQKMTSGSEDSTAINNNICYTSYEYP